MAPGFYHRGIARAGQLAIQERQCLGVKPVKINQEHDAISVTAQEGDFCKAETRERSGRILGHSLSDLDSYSSYVDVDNLATHTEKQSNHFISNTSKGGYLDRGELRDWLRRLWKLRPDLHTRLWKVRISWNQPTITNVNWQDIYIISDIFVGSCMIRCYLGL
jgi:hypothetical protein